MASTTVYATVLELRARIERVGADDDATLLSILTAASRAVDNLCNRREFGFTAPDTATAKLYSGSGGAIQSIDECVEVASVEVKDSLTDSSYTEWAATDWIAFSGDPVDPNYNETPYTYLMVDVTGDQSHFTSGLLSRGSRKDYYFRDTYSGGAYGYGSRRGYNPRNARGQPTVRVTARWGYSDTTPEPIREATLMTAARFWKRYQSSMSDVLASGELGQLLYQQALDPAIKNLLVLGRYVKPAVGRR